MPPLLGEHRLDVLVARSAQNAAAEKKRPKEEREILNRYKVFAKLQTAEDFEVLVDGLICGFLSFHVLDTGGVSS